MLAAKVSISSIFPDLPKNAPTAGRRLPGLSQRALSRDAGPSLRPRGGAEESHDAKPKAPQVTMSFTAYCGVCKKAARFMTKLDRHRRQRHREGQRRPAGAAHESQAAGVQANGVPVFDVGGKILPGFDPGRLLKMDGKTPKAPKWSRSPRDIRVEFFEYTWIPEGVGVDGCWI